MLPYKSLKSSDETNTYKVYIMGDILFFRAIVHEKTPGLFNIAQINKLNDIKYYKFINIKHKIIDYQKSWDVFLSPDSNLPAPTKVVEEYYKEKSFNRRFEELIK